MNDQCLKPASHVLTQEAGSELVLFNTKTNSSLYLNETAALIWQNLDGIRTVADVVATIQANYPNESVADDILHVVRSLQSSGFVEPSK